MTLTGVLLVDKSAGPTSHDIVQKIRRIIGERRVGHAGTLDPFATGLLPLCIGRATRLAQFVTGFSKTYRARLRFGFATDTYDLTGTPATPASSVRVSEQRLLDVLSEFEGRQQQTPPPFSAKRVGGKRAYTLARAGAAPELPPVWIQIDFVRLLSFSDDEAEIEVRVSKGTYVRTLAHDIGGRLGCGAHLSALRRTVVGAYQVERAVPIEELESGHIPLQRVLLTVEESLSAFPALSLSWELAFQLSRGQRIPWSELEDVPSRALSGDVVRVDGPSGELIALARWPDPGEPLCSEMVWREPRERSSPPQN